MEIEKIFRINDFYFVQIKNIKYQFFKNKLFPVRFFKIEDGFKKVFLPDVDIIQDKKRIKKVKKEIKIKEKEYWENLEAYYTYYDHF